MVKMHQQGDKFHVYVDETLLQTGWYGGRFVTYSADRTVKLANIVDPVGFLLHGYKLRDMESKPYDYVESSEFTPFRYENNYIDGSTKVVIIAGGGDYDFNKYAYDTTKVYTVNELLYVDAIGRLTNVNGGGNSIGIVCATPQTNNNWLGVNLRM